MGLQPRAVRRGGNHRVIFVAALALATFAAVTPCFAIETGQPPNLPPPPPPPMTTATPGTSLPPPRSSPPRQAPPPASSPPPATASASTADSGALDGGPHALDTRWFIAPLI